MLIIGNYYPIGKFPLIIKKDLEAVAQSELGSGYSVRINIYRMIPPEKKLDSVDILITRIGEIHV